MESRQIREKFLSFFESKSHKIIPSASLVVKDDPTLMFTNAGMNQFKDYFLGNKPITDTRIVDTQKCLRVSGKHNDLEEVGIDTYHHTMFEMLGNWSFGDYFKEEAIDWAWELLTVVYKLPKDRIYATIFEGDKAGGLDEDTEAVTFWEKHLPQDRILRGSKKDNFWEMGEIGPCGPCSELHIDLRSDEEVDKISGKELVNMDHPQVVELWNLVFIQFNRKQGGKLENLPAKHIDTGMGFERLAMALQKKQSNYDTDIFQPMIKLLADKASVKYGDSEKADIALRVIVDHIRAIVFAITDGQLPSNTGAGYVIRRILRRAVRYGFQFLNFKQPFLTELLPLLKDQFSDVFPELNNQLEFAGKVIIEEETSFLRTLENGLKRLEVVVSQLKKTSKLSIDGQLAFELYDTFGFPLDLTALIARENNLEVDEVGFKEAMSVQKNRSKADALKETGDWVTLDNSDSVEFVGYDQNECEARIIKYRTLKQKGKEQVQLVFDKTPFYAESGGQVGDSGLYELNGEAIKIVDTKKENDLIVHFANKIPSNPKGVGKCTIDQSKRALTMNNHTATHLMHAALRQVLGKHVEQRGSLVNEKILRFDFSHFSKMTQEEINSVEDIVNNRIRQNIALDEKRSIPIEDAKELGAMALFGEKYGNEVRVISFDPQFSVELCGGTHVTNTGQIGLFKIISESSIASGIRRIEAVTATGSEKLVRDTEEVMQQVKDILKNPKDVPSAIANMISEKVSLEKQLEILKSEKAGAVKQTLLAKISNINGINVLIEKVDLPDANTLKQLSFEIKNQIEELFLVLAADIKGKPQIAVVLSDSLVKDKGLHAGNIVKSLAAEIKGGGGGQPFYATAGGQDINGLEKVLAKAADYLK